MKRNSSDGFATSFFRKAAVVKSKSAISQKARGSPDPVGTLNFSEFSSLKSSVIVEPFLILNVLSVFVVPDVKQGKGESLFFGQLPPTP